MLPSLARRSILPLAKLKSMKVTPVKARSDNWMYIIQDSAGNSAAVVDPYNAAGVQQEVEKQGVKVTHLLTTHHHDDHSGGNRAFLKAFPGIECVGGSSAIPGLTKQVKGGDRFTIGEALDVECIHTPCHTQDSICFFVTDRNSNEKVVLTGDTLFTAGCGRFFEGTPAEMHAALQKLMKLPDETVVLNGHEYTVGSAKFGASIEPANTDLQTLIAAANKGDTIHNSYTIGDEKRWNVFVRLAEPAVVKATGTTDAVAAMKKLREMKNNA